jgi:hypothetical protein
MAMLVFAVPGEKPALKVLALFVPLMGIFVFLELSGRKWLLFNSGPSPWLPNLLEACVGVWFALLILDGSPRARRAVAVIAVVVVAAALLWHPFEDWYSRGWGRSYGKHEVLGRSDGLDQLRRWLVGEEIPTRRKAYFNPTLVAFPWLLANIVVLYFAQVPLTRLLETRFMRVVLSIGRHALGAYVLHLVLLAALVSLFEQKRFIPSQGWAIATLLGLLGACYAWALGREAQARRRRRLAGATRPAAAAPTGPSPPG